MSQQAVLETNLALPVRRGKVRDVYDLGEHLLLVATDRISAFDWVLPTGIPDKGRILTQISAFWFFQLDEPHHLITTAWNEIAPLLPAGADGASLAGRSMLVKKTEVVPFECVVRGYLAGSGWKDYQQDGAVCGIEMPPGMQKGQQLPEPIFTPATKAETGHDINVPFATMADAIGAEMAETLRQRSLEVYLRGAEWAAARGILIADTKFEWGRCGDELILIDEVLTPDSSRFWPADAYTVGQNQPSFDKQFVRDWLESTDWDKASPPPTLPDEIVAKTRQKYADAFAKLTGTRLGHGDWRS